MIRKIVEIDREKCNGCGLCVPSCAEGAISIVDGKAVLSADNLCDGLGACLGDCPEGAIRIIEREAEEFDEAAVEAHLHKRESAGPKTGSGKPAVHGGCPGARTMTFAPSRRPEEAATGQPSQLTQWPVQLGLVPVTAPFFQDADILIAADCVAFAYADFHRDFLAGRAVVIGCPKLDDTRGYLEKLTELFCRSSVRSVTVVRMEVPCCGGIVMVARQALAASGKDIPFREVTITVQGEIRD